MNREYIIVVAFTIVFIEQMVNRKLEAGWRLQGGITVDNKGNLYQAMVLVTNIHGDVIKDE